MFHQPEVTWFYGLPTATQDLWLDHARNLRSGAYETRQAPRKRSHVENMEAQRRGILAARDEENDR